MGCRLGFGSAGAHDSHTVAKGSRRLQPPRKINSYSVSPHRTGDHCPAASSTFLVAHNSLTKKQGCDREPILPVVRPSPCADIHQLPALRHIRDGRTTRRSPRCPFRLGNGLHGRGESITPGRDFAEAIEDAVGSCGIVLVIIGSRWLTAVDDSGRRRLDLPADLVALEVGAGLARGVPVVPVLVDGAAPPCEKDELPGCLAALARLQALRIDHESFPADTAALITMLERLSPTLVRPVDRERRTRPATRTFVASLIAVFVALLTAGAILFAPSGAADSTITGKVVSNWSGLRRRAYLISATRR